MIERFRTDQFITLKVNAEAINVLQVAVDHMLEHLDENYDEAGQDSTDVLVLMALMTQVKQELVHTKLREINS